VIASQYREMARNIGKGTLLDVLYPRAEDTNRNLVLLFAGHRAGVTADTAILIDYEA
jgi:hypothetical protein